MRLWVQSVPRSFESINDMIKHIISEAGMTSITDIESKIASAGWHL